MNSMKINWVKPTTSNHCLKYIKEGVKKTYTPDFFLSKYNVYLEIKGYWWGDDKDKMRLVINQNPEVNIKIIEKSDYEKFIIDGDIDYILSLNNSTL